MRLGILFLLSSAVLAQAEDIEFTTFDLVGDQLTLVWEGGTQPYRVQSSLTLPPNWVLETDALTSPMATINVGVDTARQFFRVVSAVQYRLTFQGDWTATNHPTDFPSDDHFSKLIGGTHNDQVAFWAPGAMATPGIKKMAETGNPSPLDDEVEAAMAAMNAGEVIEAGDGVSSGDGQRTVTFTATQAYPMVSVVTMIAPSPDWFIGVHGVVLFENDEWKDEVVVSLQPYDAGTDSGSTYGSGNSATNPQQPISQITGFPFDVSGVVAPLGTFTFTRLN